MDSILGNIQEFFTTIPQKFMDNPAFLFEGVEGLLAGLGGLRIPMILLAVIALTIFARYSYSLLNFVLGLSGAVGAGAATYFLLAPMLGEALNMGDNTILRISMTVIAALIGAALMIGIKNIAIFLLGAAAGFLPGMLLQGWLVSQFSMEFLIEYPSIVPLVVALICGVIALFLFKYAFIFCTAIACMSYAVVIFMSLFGLAFPWLIFAELGAGIVLGLVIGFIQARRVHRR